MVERMEAQLVLHEGVKLRPYLDTDENWTLGVGYNVTARGLDDFERIIGRTLDWSPFGLDPTAPQPDLITRDEALEVLRADIVRVDQATRVYFPEYASLDPIRQRVCLDLAFNLGFRALGFKNTIAAVKQHDWSTAARELFKSKWAYQVGDGPGGRYDRADRLAHMLLTGQDYSS
jgi:lysozyme